MVSFGLITEGITDQIVIESVMYGFYNSRDLDLIPLQPLRDASNENKATSPGNWHKVIEYCGSEKLEMALRQENYYLIIQLDTDVLLTENVPKEFQLNLKNEKGEDLNIDEIVSRVKNLLISRMPEGVYELYQTKIIFAITVHSIECWLLPLYYKNNKKAKLENALDTLNKALQKSEGFSIDPNNKDPEYYRLISKKYWKHKEFIRLYQANPSLKIFIEELQSRNIPMDKDEDDW
ncbi:MAG: hypothetical protein NW226_20010 [Microscillaceae bacterium]|nr:hypothetical protein [Microscillaceae bacterium]